MGFSLALEIRREAVYTGYPPTYWVGIAPLAVGRLSLVHTQSSRKAVKIAKKVKNMLVASH